MRVGGCATKSKSGSDAEIVFRVLLSGQLPAAVEYRIREKPCYHGSIKYFKKKSQFSAHFTGGFRI
jgi:hypothetical protein